MELLDERGRLFGRVNVVDAFVVLFALAVVVAGATLVLGDGPGGQSAPGPEPETMYVTLATDDSESTALQAGEVELDGASANVTDVHRTAGPRTYLRVALNGTATDEGFQFEGNRVRVGDAFTVTDDATRTGGRVIERDVEPEFEVRTSRVVVETTLRTPVADAVAEGDEQRVGDAAVLTVASTETARVNETHTEVRATLELDARVVDGVSHYGGRPVRLGRELDVRTDDYEFDAGIVARG